MVRVNANYFVSCAATIRDCFSVFARSTILTFPPEPEAPAFPVEACPATSAGNASNEFVDEGDREQRPRGFGHVSNTCSC